MPQTAPGSKQRLEQVAAEILATDGYNGMGMKAVSDAAALPAGSIYHHFPGGKEELAAAAIGGSGTSLAGLLRHVFAGGIDAAAIRTMFGYMADKLERSGWTSGCPIGTPALDGPAAGPVVQEACGQALGELVRATSEALAAGGRPRRDAEALGTTLVAAYEGATLLARAQRSSAPLAAAAESMVRLLEASSPG